MKVAVIGSGIAGLACAYHLSRRAEVHVFEAGDHIGGHTNTVEVTVLSGTYPIDTGFIVFNDWTYPRFIKLMTALNVASQPSNMSFSVKVEKSGLEYNGTNLNGLFAQRSNFLSPNFYRMILSILRFNRESLKVLDDPQIQDMPLGRYLAENNYAEAFVDHYIIPMGAAIWSAGVAKMKEFPIGYFVRFFKNHGMLSVDDRPQWRVIQKGSRSYLPALTKPFQDRIELRTPAKRVRRADGGAIVTVERNGKLDETRFDHVVLAGHADESLAILADASPLEREILSAFPYQANNTILHTDTSVLPKNRRAWAAWNYLVPARAQDDVAVSYDMNILQSINAPETFIVSLNMEDRIDPKKILRKILYHHPVYNARGVAAQKRWHEISNVNNTHFCGAYWGFGFHEDGVVSGERVAESLGANP